MKITQTQTVNRDVHVGTQCDVCGKEVMEKEPEGWQPVIARWYYHGGEADEDVTHACSVRCYMKLLYELLRRHDDNYTLEINEMKPAFVKQLLATLSETP